MGTKRRMPSRNLLLALVALAMVLMVRGVTDPIDDELAGMGADLGSGDYDERVQRHTSKVSSGVKETDKEFDREIKKEEAGETSAERRHDKIVQMRDDYEEARNDDSQETGKMYEHLRDSALDDGRKGGSTEAERKARWGGGH